MKQLVTFLKTGEVTWVSKSGKTENRQHVRSGSSLIASNVTKNMGHFEIWQGGWSILMNHQNVRISPLPHQLAKLAEKSA